MRGEVLELYSEQLLREGREEGMRMGIRTGREEGIREGVREGIRAVVNACISLGATKDVTLQKLMEGFGLPREEAGEMLEQYWK